MGDDQMVQRALNALDQGFSLSTLNAARGRPTSSRRQGSASCMGAMHACASAAASLIGCPHCRRCRRCPPRCCRHCRRRLPRVRCGHLSQWAPLSGTALPGTGLQACGRCPAPPACSGPACDRSTGDGTRSGGKLELLELERMQPMQSRMHTADQQTKGSGGGGSRI